MSHAIRQVFSIAALAFLLIGAGSVTVQSAMPTMPDAVFLGRCATGTAEEVHQALDSGANIAAQDTLGMTALMIAAKYNADPAVMEVLLEAADEFNEKNLWQKGKSALGFKTMDINDGNKGSNFAD